MEQISKQQRFIQKLTEIVEANMSNENFGVTELASEVGLSQSGLLRRLKKISGQSINQFIREIRLDRAKILLEDKDATIAEVAYKVGFGSSTYFSKCFHEYFGYPPGEARIHISTNPFSDKNQQQEDQNISNGRKIPASLVMAVATVIAMLVILLLIFKPFSPQAHDKEKTIAVLPIRNDSPDSINIFFINGMMEAILNNLARVEDLDVRSRTSTEAYRGTNKTIQAIAEELEVNYIVEASGQKYDNEVLLNIQLIEASNDRHLLSEQYRSSVESVKDLVDLQLEISYDIVSKIDTEITPEEEAKVAKLPTDNPAAYHLFLRAWAQRESAEYSRRYYNENQYQEEMLGVKGLLEEALSLDSTFSQALASLGHIYFDNLYFRYPGHEIQYMDTAIQLFNKALEYDPENQYALKLKYHHYMRIGNYKEAGEIEHLFTRHSRDYKFYELKFKYYMVIGDYGNALLSYYKYLELKPLDQLNPIWKLEQAKIAFYQAGFFNEARNIAHEIFKRNNDSIDYLHHMVYIELYAGKYQKALEYGMAEYEIDSTIWLCNRDLMHTYLCMGDYSQALYYLNRCEALQKEQSYSDNPNLNISKGYVYLMNGMEKKATLNFQAEIERLLHQIELNTPEAQRYDTHFSLALTYFLMGEKEKGMEYLNMQKHRDYIGFSIISNLKFFTPLAELRKDPEFKKLSEDLESRFLKQQARIRKMLAEEGIIH